MTTQKVVFPYLYVQRYFKEEELIIYLVRRALAAPLSSQYAQGLHSSCPEKSVRSHKLLLENACMWAFSSRCSTARLPSKAALPKKLGTLYAHLKPPCLSIAEDESWCWSTRQCPVPSAEWQPPRERCAQDLNTAFDTPGYNFLCSIYEVFQDLSLEGAIPEKHVLCGSCLTCLTKAVIIALRRWLTCRKAHRHVLEWQMVLTAVFCGQWVINTSLVWIAHSFLLKPWFPKVITFWNCIVCQPSHPFSILSPVPTELLNRSED